MFGKLPAAIWLGYNNEQNARTVELDISEMLALYPSATPQLLVHKSEDYVNYIATTTADGGTLSWVVTAYDLSHQKNGTAQVVLTQTGDSSENDIVLASQVIPVKVEPGINDVSTSELPEPMETFLEQILAAAAAAQAAFTSPGQHYTLMRPGRENDGADYAI